MTGESDEVRGEDYPDGRPKTRITYRGQVAHGPARAWWDNGQLHWEVPFQDDARHGCLRVWYRNGQLESVREYVGGKKHGPFTDFHDNGVKAAEGRYRDDALVEIREWHPDGTPAEPSGDR